MVFRQSVARQQLQARYNSEEAALWCVVHFECQNQSIIVYCAIMAAIAEFWNVCVVAMPRHAGRGQLSCATSDSWEQKCKWVPSSHVSWLGLITHRPNKIKLSQQDNQTHHKRSQKQFQPCSLASDAHRLNCAASCITPKPILYNIAKKCCAVP